MKMHTENHKLFQTIKYTLLSCVNPSSQVIKGHSLLKYIP